MRNRVLLWMVLGILAPLSTANAQVSVSLAYHVDPSWDPGGYWEATVTNNTGGDVYFIAIGNTGVNQTVVRYPDLTGWWEPNYLDKYDWDTNEFNFLPTAWTPPALSDFPTDTYFPGQQQVLLYYVLGAQPALGNGSVQNGLYFNYAPVRAMAMVALPPSSTELPFIAFNGAGELVAQGVTTGPPLASREGTWGAIKALYR